MNKLILVFISVLFIGSCNLGSSFEEEFKIHIKQTDTIIYNGDYLHPEKVYIKNNKPIGFEFRSNNEFGKYSKLTFVDGSERIKKIIIRKDYFSNLEKTFDSIYVIEPQLNKLTVYSNENRKGKIVLHPKIIKDEIFDVNKKLNQIKKWNN